MVLLLAAIALACSAPSLRNGFVYDDVPAVQEDERLASPGWHLLAASYWGPEIRDRLYRPLTTASFGLDHALGGGRPFVFHLTNVLLNLVVVLLVFALARHLLGHLAAAFVAALWFAVHPVHVEVVANVVGRSELIAAAGYLAAVLAWLKESEAAATAPGGPRRALLAAGVLLGAAIAFGGKEHALTLPAALLLCDGWRSRTRGERFALVFRRHAVTWLGVVAIAMGFLAARAALIGTAFGGGSVGAGIDGLGVADRALVMTPALLVWTRLLLFPLHLSADYSPDQFVPAAIFGLRHALALVLLAALTAGAWLLRRRAPALLFALLWMIITASVAANIVVPTGVMLAERTLYLPSAGAAVAAGALWLMLPRGRALWPVTAAVLTLLAARSVSRAAVWRDDESFYQALVRDAPDSYRSHWAIGARAFQANRMAEGERAYLRAIRIYPRDGAVMQELGERYWSATAWEPAERWLTMAWRADSLRFDAAVQAVLLRLRLGRPDSAAALGEETLRRFPDAPTILMATSDAWFTLGRPARALSLRRRAVFAAPGVWQYQHVAAEGAQRAGRCDEARWRADRARRMAPEETAPRELVARLEAGECASS